MLMSEKFNKSLKICKTNKFYQNQYNVTFNLQKEINFQLNEVFKYENKKGKLLNICKSLNTKQFGQYTRKQKSFLNFNKKNIKQHQIIILEDLNLLVNIKLKLFKNLCHISTTQNFKSILYKIYIEKQEYLEQISKKSYAFQLGQIKKIIKELRKYEIKLDFYFKEKKIDKNQLIKQNFPDVQLQYDQVDIQHLQQYINDESQQKPILKNSNPVRKSVVRISSMTSLLKYQEMDDDLKIKNKQQYKKITDIYFREDHKKYVEQLKKNVLDKQYTIKRSRSSIELKQGIQRRLQNSIFSYQHSVNNKIDHISLQTKIYDQLQEPIIPKLPKIKSNLQSIIKPYQPVKVKNLDSYLQKF